jgi:hypothetical protein
LASNKVVAEPSNIIAGGKQMNSSELRIKVFEPVAGRVLQKADSLKSVKRFPRSGIEGWLKVEAVAALGSLVCRLQNRGPDIKLTDGTMLELKAATDLNPKYIRDGVSKCEACLFLADASDPEKLSQLDGDGIKVSIHRLFPDGSPDWVIGLLMKVK